MTKTSHTKSIIYLALSPIFTDDGERDGVCKKIIAQTEAMERNGYDALILGYDDRGIALGRADKTVLHSVATSSQIRRWALFKYAMILCSHKTVDILYIRYPYCDPWFIAMLRSVRKSGVEVVIEIATYPIEKIPLSSGFKLAVLSKSDTLFRRLMKKYVKEVRVIGEKCDMVFGIPATNIINAINADSIPVAERPDDDEIRIVGVSTCKIWHGYDRIIRGLGNYYATGEFHENVTLTLIGDGGIKDDWEGEANRLGIADKVCFTGMLDSSEIDEVFAHVSIALGSLGLHRVGLNYISTLKCKEYCARGVPFLCSNVELGFPDNFPYFIKVAPDESIIDIAKVIAEFRAIIDSHQDYSNEMRAYAQQHLRWDRYMKFEY